MAQEAHITVDCAMAEAQINTFGIDKKGILVNF